MSRIQKTTLGEISKSIQYGYTESASKLEIGPKFLRITDIQNDFINWANVPYCKISEDDFKKYKLNIGDIVIARTGNSTGSNSVIKKDVKAVFASYLIRFQLKHEIAYYGYIDFILRSNYWRNFVKAIKGGSAQGGANASNFANFPIFLPPLQDQQKIASTLSTLDSKIELNNKINTELEAMAKTLYDYWFVQFDFPDENGKPYKSSGGEMIWSKELKRNIPKGWEVQKLKDIFVFEKGIEPGSSEYLDSSINENCIKFFRVGDIEGESSVYVDSSNKKYVMVEERDVIVTFDGSVGKLGFGLKGAFSGGLRKIYDKSKKIDNSLVYFIFKDERIIATIHKYATGSILLHASSAIDHLAIPFKENIYLQFQKIVKPIFDQMVKNKQENQKLAELRDFLLPMLMNGQIVVE